MSIVPSPLESARFGLRIARGSVETMDEVAALPSAIGTYDVIIVRAPVELQHVAVTLAAHRDVVAFTADHLVYWEWTAQSRPDDPMPCGFRVVDRIGAAELEALVRASFHGYRNHYAANPLLDPAGIVEGYVEWALGLLGSSSTSSRILLDAEGSAIGFGLLDHSSEAPDVRLAAMHPDAQGAGLYRHVLGALMAEVMDRGASGLRISTQSANVKVMQAWSRIGFVPTATYATYHLVDRELLASVV